MAAKDFMASLSVRMFGFSFALAEKTRGWYSLQLPPILPQELPWKLPQEPAWEDPGDIVGMVVRSSKVNSYTRYWIPFGNLLTICDGWVYNINWTANGMKMEKSIMFWGETFCCTCKALAQCEIPKILAGCIDPLVNSVRLVHVDSTSVCMWHLVPPFWWCADTPQNVKRWWGKKPFAASGGGRKRRETCFGNGIKCQQEDLGIVE
eukprot:5015422-Ditylum_brightwellii.AAC.1